MKTNWNQFYSMEIGQIHRIVMCHRYYESNFYREEKKRLKWRLELNHFSTSFFFLVVVFSTMSTLNLIDVFSKHLDIFWEFLCLIIEFEWKIRLVLRTLDEVKCVQHWSNEFESFRWYDRDQIGHWFEHKALMEMCCWSLKVEKHWLKTNVQIENEVFHLMSKDTRISTDEKQNIVESKCLSWITEFDEIPSLSETVPLENFRDEFGA